MKSIKKCVIGAWMLALCMTLCGCAMTVEEMYQRGNPVHPATLEALDDLKGKKP